MVLLDLMAVLEHLQKSIVGKALSNTPSCLNFTTALSDDDMGKQMGLGEKPIAGIGPLGGCPQSFFGEGNPHRDDKGNNSC